MSLDQSINYGHHVIMTIMSYYLSLLLLLASQLFVFGRTEYA